MCTFQPSISCWRSVYSSAFIKVRGRPGGTSWFFYRRADQVAPFGPRAVIVLHVVVAEQIFQHEPRVTRSLADAAIRDDRLVAGHADAAVQLLQLGDALERAVVVGGFRPGNAFRARNM